MSTPAATRPTRTAASRAAAAPFRFFDVHVVRTASLGPDLVRVTFGGGDLAALVSGGRDQRIKLFLPRPGQDRPVIPADTGADGGWYPAWREMDPQVRAVMRTYTVRAQRRAPEEVDIDFAVHGDTGPASAWAGRVRPGDRAALLGPVEADNGGVDFRPPEGTETVLLAADESALPAVAAILETLPERTTARAWIEVGDAADIQRLESPAAAEITWLVRGAGPGLTEAVRASDLPAGRTYAWIAGEAGAVKELRRHLVGERGMDRRAVTFTGYWRRGTAEDQLLP